MPIYATLRRSRTLNYRTPDGAPLRVMISGPAEAWGSVCVRVRLATGRARRQFFHAIAHFGLKCELADATGETHCYRVSGPVAALAKLERCPGVLSVAAGPERIY